MSRLIDRIVAKGGARPSRVSDVMRASYIAQSEADRLSAFARARDDGMSQVRQGLASEHPGLSEADLSRQSEAFYRRGAARPIAPESAVPASVFLEVPTIAVDDVAVYAAGLPDGSDIASLVGPLAPPFDRMFLEAQGTRPRDQATDSVHAWGILLEAFFADEPEEELGSRWLLNLSLFIEWDKGDPVGPLINYELPVMPDGTWRRRPDGSVELLSSFPGNSPAGGTNEFHEAQAALKSFLVAPLLGLSFMHARNAELRLTEPPPRLVRSWQKRRGQPLSRYYVLEIEPLRRFLDGEGEAQRRGLRHALHICRGHFKTYTEEAPLLGRHVGTYWWPAQMRGRREAGRVEKDYRVGSPGVGRPYAEADERFPQPPHGLASADDPDALGRGALAHARTQNALARALQAAGARPRSPRPAEPRYDIGWEGAREEIWVAEVKSLTPNSEERQLRMALGQVLRYRYTLAASTARDVQAVIATEREPSDAGWRVLCDEHDVVLVVPEAFGQLAERSRR